MGTEVAGSVLGGSVGRLKMVVRRAGSMWQGQLGSVIIEVPSGRSYSGSGRVAPSKITSGPTSFDPAHRGARSQKRRKKTS